MKRFYFLLFLLAYITPVYCQDSSYVFDEDLKHGVEFQIGSFLTLTSYGGYTFAYRYVYKENAGLRLGINTNINTEQYKVTQQADSVIIHPPNHNNSYNFKVVAQYLKTIKRFQNFGLIIGGGPFISFYRSDRYSENLGGPLYRQKYSDTESGFSFGFDIVGGIDYRLFSNVSLTAEYGFSIERKVSEIENETSESYPSVSRVTKYSGSKSTFSMNSTGARLGVAVFF